MFQSEHLVEKWKPLLEHEGLDKIEDAHKRSVTAVLLENQEKFLRESASFQESGSLLAEAGPTNNTLVVTHQVSVVLLLQLVMLLVSTQF